MTKIKESGALMGIEGNTMRCGNFNVEVCVWERSLIMGKDGGGGGGAAKW